LALFQDDNFDLKEPHPKELRDLSSQMLAGVKVKFGRDSNEYEMAGGTRLSDINRHPHAGGKKSGDKGEGERL
jgi:hypothetical protein